MSFEVFRTCIDKIPVNTDIHFSGMCEPWLNPNCTKMLIYAHERGHKVHIFTSLVGMSNEDYNLIKHIPFETFVLHIPDEEGNSGFCITDSYLQLFDRIMNDVKSGCFRIDGFSCHGAVHPAIFDLVMNSKIRVNSQMNTRAGNVSPDCGLDPVKPLVGDIMCRWCGGTSLDRNVLLPNGLVLMCCMDYGMEYPLGNLLEESYLEISDGHLKTTYRDMMTSEQKGKILCRYCSRAIHTSIKP